VTEAGLDYFECGECVRHAERRIMLDPEMGHGSRRMTSTFMTVLAWRYVIEKRRGELEDR
jgi:hypothetical protein